MKNKLYLLNHFLLHLVLGVDIYAVECRQYVEFNLWKSVAKHKSHITWIVTDFSKRTLD